MSQQSAECVNATEARQFEQRTTRASRDLAGRVQSLFELTRYTTLHNIGTMKLELCNFYTTSPTTDKQTNLNEMGLTLRI